MVLLIIQIKLQNEFRKLKQKVMNYTLRQDL